jgi:hypothetical protein
VTARLATRLRAAILVALGAISTPANAAEMIAQPIARLQGLDKATARVSQFEVPVTGQAQFGTLSIWVRACKRNPPEESPENAAFLEIFENRPGEAKVKVFSGWMFSSSPALSALENPVYDVNLLECKGAPPPPVPATPSTPAPSPPSSRGKSAR